MAILAYLPIFTVKWHFLLQISVSWSLGIFVFLSNSKFPTTVQHFRLRTKDIKHQALITITYRLQNNFALLDDSRGYFPYMLLLYRSAEKKDGKLEVPSIQATRCSLYYPLAPLFKFFSVAYLQIEFRQIELLHQWIQFSNKGGGGLTFISHLYKQFMIKLCPVNWVVGVQQKSQPRC